MVHLLRKCVVFYHGNTQKYSLNSFLVLRNCLETLYLLTTARTSTLLVRAIPCDAQAQPSIITADVQFILITEFLP